MCVSNGKLCVLCCAVKDLPKCGEEDKFYQLCYCTESKNVMGVSIPFTFREVHEDELVEFPKEQNKEFWTFRSRFAVLMDNYWVWKMDRFGLYSCVCVCLCVWWVLRTVNLSEIYLFTAYVNGEENGFGYDDVREIRTDCGERHPMIFVRNSFGTFDANSVTVLDPMGSPVLMKLDM